MKSHLWWRSSQKLKLHTCSWSMTTCLVGRADVTYNTYQTITWLLAWWKPINRARNKKGYVWHCYVLPHTNNQLLLIVTWFTLSDEWVKVGVQHPSASSDPPHRTIPLWSCTESLVISMKAVMQALLVHVSQSKSNSHTLIPLDVVYQP